MPRAVPYPSAMQTLSVASLHALHGALCDALVAVFGEEDCPQLDDMASLLRAGSVGTCTCCPLRRFSPIAPPCFPALHRGGLCRRFCRAECASDVAPLPVWLREVCLHARFWSHFVQSRVLWAGTNLYATGAASLASVTRAIGALRALSHDMKMLKAVVGSIALVRRGWED